MRRADKLAHLELDMEAAKMEHERRTSELKHPVVREMERQRWDKEAVRLQQRWVELSGEVSVNG